MGIQVQKFFMLISIGIFCLWWVLFQNNVAKGMSVSDVYFIDQIMEGENKGVQLGVVKRKYVLGSEVSGAELGTDRDVGSYHTGYIYWGCTSAKVVKEGAVVYRFFKPLHYGIAFDGNGNTSGNMPQIQDCFYGEKIQLPDVLYRKEHVVTLNLNSPNASCNISRLVISNTFLGWSLEPDGVVRYQDGESLRNLTEKEEQVTLYAVWKEKTVTIEELPVNPGYHFAGWSKKAEDSVGEKSFSVQDNMELFAIWEKDEVSDTTEYFKVSILGYIDGKIQCIYQEMVQNGSIFTFPKLFEENGSGGVWRYRDKEEQRYLAADQKMIYEDTEFYAQSIVRMHSNAEQDKVMESLVDYGQNYALMSVERQGYQLLGWYAPSEDVLYEAGVLENVINDTDLYAKWSAPLVYKVVYDIDKSILKIAENERNIYQYGEGLVLPDRTQVIVKEGYVFEGWYLAEDKSKNCITKISEEHTGDVVLGALIQYAAKSSESEAEKEKVDDMKKSITPTKESEQSDVASDQQGKNTFWLQKVKYKILSDKKKTVQIAANKLKKSRVILPGTIQYHGDKYKVVSIGKKAFYGNSYIRNLRISSGILYIESSSFQDMKNLKQLTIGEDVKKIRKTSFCGNKQLVKVVFLSKKLEAFGQNVFFRIHKKAVIHASRQIVRKYGLIFQKYFYKIKTEGQRM